MGVCISFLLIGRLWILVAARGLLVEGGARTVQPTTITSCDYFVFWAQKLILQQVE